MKHMLRSICTAAAVVTAALVLYGCATADRGARAPVAGVPQMAEKLSAHIEEFMKNNGVEGLSIAVLAHGERDEDRFLWSNGFGWAVKSRGLHATADTAFPTASVTKLFTATAVMQLAEEGLVDLDAPASRYLPEFSILPSAKQVTVRRLLTHHAGLPADRLKGMLAGANTPDEAETIFMEMPSLLAGEHLINEPGSYYCYSNIGYTLLGCIVSRVSGMPYQEYVEKRILNPLRMRNSAVRRYESLGPGLSMGYRKGKEVDIPRMSGVPEGGLAASANDMAAYLRMLLAEGAYEGSRIMKSETVRKMLHEQNAAVALDLDFRIGLGFHLGKLGGGGSMRTAYHQGGTAPFSSLLEMLPDQGLGVMVLANTDEANLAGIASRALELALEVKTGRAAAAPRSGAAVQGEHPDPNDFIGLYASEMGLVEIAGGLAGPVLKISGGTLSIVPAENGTHALQMKLFGLIPLSPPGVGDITLRFARVNGEKVIGVSIGGMFGGLGVELAVHPVSDAWRARTGDYRVLNPDAEPFVEKFSLECDERGLLFCVVKVKTASNPFRLVLDPISDTTVMTAGKGRHLGERMTMVSVNGAEAISYSGLLLQRSE